MNAAGIAAPEIDWAGREASDSQLVAAVRAGDDGAFAELYRRHQPSVARFVRARVHDHGRAEDVVQEAFVSALRRMRQTDTELAFRAWIFEIARNASIDLYRRSSRAEEVSMDVAGGLAPADASRLSGTSGPDASLLRKESFDHFRGALDELSETHHRIIVMRELEGRSYREIGERMELSQAAVESTLFRARRKLEHEFQQLDSGHRCRMVGSAIGRLAEGMESNRDRARLDRHARRCSACRRQARQLGVEPLLGSRRRRIATRAAAILPLPGFLRRRSSSTDGADAASGSGLQHTAHQLGAALGPSIEVVGGVAAKAVAVVATVVVIGGGGATLGGVGPFAVGNPDSVPGQPPSSERSAPPQPPGGLNRDGFVAPAIGPRSAAGASPRTGEGHRAPAPQRAPASPPAGDQPAVEAPPASLPPVSDPAGGGTDPQAPGVPVPVPEEMLLTPAPDHAPDSPPPAGLGVGAPDLTPPATEPDPVGFVGESLANTGS